ncbi:class I SAM-dependent methyltransferase [Mucilaginibacter sp. RS28]|uniref:Class I SAM-dependent methyltransferase n=1 Tax=Mucilaginibacter straminoryzae TaxID=2932774 RepID=A0A9X2BA87_9SPHI|nr:class I SAM-dependent methyltransferase [Mucilaginibacter straminoryzae]MCJ8208532.1 class I SAM-dependent methyltransferase [Mucilaginibacter straminoryzae]
MDLPTSGLSDYIHFMQTVEAFYDQLSSRYTELISRCVPRYTEIFYNLFYYIPDDLQPKRILDLGCGTGNLTEAALKHYPNAEIHALDISADILNECRKRFEGHNNIYYHQQDFTRLDLPEGSFDLIISSIAIHHINDEDKARLYPKIYSLLKPNGIFVFADQTKGATDEIYQKHIGRWKEEAMKLGSTEADWQLWMDHQDAHDYHAPVGWHLKQLEGACFALTDVIWKNIMWAVIWARK